MSNLECKKSHKTEWTKLASVVERMLLAYALVFAQGAWAAQNQAAKDKSASPQKAAAQQAKEKQSAAAPTPVAQNKQAQGEESESAAEEKPSNDASHQGIKVHGHWTIEVKNPDGTLVRHVEFENSFVGGQLGGGDALSAILAGKATLVAWAVYFMDIYGGPCADANGKPTSCALVQSGIVVPPFTLSSFSPTLSVTEDSNYGLVLSGQVMAAFNGSIGLVQTSIFGCPAPLPSPTYICNYGSGSTPYAFTKVTASVSNPSFSSSVPVSAGQTIAVTVNISFS